MDVRKIIIKELSRKGEVKVSDIIEITGLSRAYINRFLQNLRVEGMILLVGKANKSKYIPATANDIKAERKKTQAIHRIFNNDGRLQEDLIFADIVKNTGIFNKVHKNITRITEYAFTEMLNNAIEHSRSKKIEVLFERHKSNILFTVQDRGVGIFNNIREQKHLSNEMEAIQDLLKGKLTTAPSLHSGEGIFFTSKAADLLIIQSDVKRLIFNNLLDDVFVKDVKGTPGTKVNFSVDINASRELQAIFEKYTDNSFKFSKTRVTVRLYEGGTEYISRSQARRILVGLEKFKVITLEFEGVETVGQGFADEIFRVWAERYKKIDIKVKNANDNVLLMINRAKANATVMKGKK